MNENSDNVERGDAQGDLGGRGTFEIIVPRLQAVDRLQEWLANVLHSDFPDLSLRSYHYRKSIGKCQLGKCVYQKNLAY